LTKLGPILAIINDEFGDGIIQDWPLRLIDTEKLRWSDDSGTLWEGSFQEVDQGLDRRFVDGLGSDSHGRCH
jgi:hypothetical protein